jgi:hypothetical protein
MQSAQRTLVPTTNVASSGADVAAEQPSGPQGLEAFRTACRGANPRWPRTRTESMPPAVWRTVRCALRVGLRDVAIPWQVCNYGASAADLTGVCEDYSRLGGSGSALGASRGDDVQLVYAHRLEGVTFVR